MLDNDEAILVKNLLKYDNIEGIFLNIEWAIISFAIFLFVTKTMTYLRLLLDA